MPEVADKKRIFQIAKELNISHLEIIRFLKNKGEEVVSHMAPVSQDIYDEILLEFSKDKQQSERYRKEQARKKVVSQIRKKQTEEDPYPPKSIVKKIKTSIEEEDFSLSIKIKQASEKLKKDKENEVSLNVREEKTTNEDKKKIKDSLANKLKIKSTKEPSKSTTELKNKVVLDEKKKDQD